MGSAAKDKLLHDSDKEEEQEEEELQLWKRLWVESKKLWIVAGPAILNRISMFGVFIIAQAFIGHIGNTELAALSLVFHVIARFSIGILMGMSSGLETLCGQAFGAKQYHMLGIYLQRSWLVEIGFFLLLTPIFIFTAPILRLLGQTEEISHTANIISLWYIPIIFSYVFLYTLQMYLQAQSKNIIITWLAVVSQVFHGVMISMNITSWVPIVGQFIFVFGGGCPQTWTGFSMHAFSDLWPVFKLSVSSGVMLCLEIWYNSVLILFTGNTKNAEVTIDALSICLNINGWELMLSFGFPAAARFSLPRVLMLQLTFTLWSRTAFPNLERALDEARDRLNNVQTSIKALGMSDQLFAQEVDAKPAYLKTLEAHEKLWVEKSRVRWLKNGDMNSKFFTFIRSVRVANELGRGSAKAAKFAIKVVIATSLIIGIVLWALVLALRHEVSYIFSSSMEVANAVSNLSILLGFTLLLNSIQPVLSGVAVGAGWQSIVAYVNIICYYCIGLPLGLLLYYAFKLGVKGMWMGMIGGTFVQTLVLLYYVYKTDWDKQVSIAQARVSRWVLPSPNEQENDSST